MGILKKERLLSVIFTIFFFSLFYATINSSSEKWDEQIDAKVKSTAQLQVNVLKNIINRAMSSAQILGSHINSLNGDTKTFSEFSQMLFSTNEAITNLQLAPDGIIKFIYPIIGHEKALGLNIFSIKSIEKETQIALKTKTLTLTGPFELAQGGRGVIGRYPLYKEKNQKEFWGFASVLISLDKLLQLSDIDTLSKRDYEYRLWRKNPSDGRMEVISGSKYIGQKNIYSETIELPNTIWYLDLKYIGQKYSKELIYLLYMISAFISAIMGHWLYNLLMKPKILKRQVDKKTEELKEKNSELIKEQLELKKLKNVVKYSSNIIVITDSKGFIEYVNLKFFEITKYDKADVIGKKHTLLKSDEIFETVKNGETWSSKMEFEYANKSYYFQVIISSIVDDEGNIINYVINSEDITKEIVDAKQIKEQEKILHHQAKMASIGEMLENIAHQWRQPLSVISTAASGIKIKKDFNLLNDKDFEDATLAIVENTKYLSNTIDDFRNYFQQNKKRQKFKIGDTIEQTIKLVSSKFKNKEIDIVSDFDDVEVETFRNELIQVLINLFNNAKDILEEKNIDKKRVIFISVKKSNNNEAIISFKDNGGGIKDDILDKIFEPYFTTKGPAKGTGIGLYMSDNIISKHMNGNIEVRNSKFNYDGVEYIGAEFIITLPLS